MLANNNSIADIFDTMMGDYCWSERTTVDYAQNVRPSDNIEAAEPQDFEFDRALMSLGERPVVLCIGTDRVTGDCLGPLVGQMLVERGVNAFVYGTLSRPVTALTLKDTVKQVMKAHRERKVLAVDASVGNASDVGKIRIGYNAIKPGDAVGKSLPRVGDVSITATVTDTGKVPLSAVRLGTVYELATKIAAHIIRVLQ